MLSSDLYDYSDSYIFAKRTKTIEGDNDGEIRNKKN